MLALIKRLTSLMSVAGDVTVHLRESGEVEVWKVSRSWQLAFCETFHVAPERVHAVISIAEAMGYTVVVEWA